MPKKPAWTWYKDCNMNGISIHIFRASSTACKVSNVSNTCRVSNTGMHLVSYN